MFKLHIEATHLDELKIKLEAALLEVGGEVVQQEPEPVTEDHVPAPKKRAKKKPVAANKKKTEEKMKGRPPAAILSLDELKAKAAALTIEDVHRALQKLNVTKGLTTARACLEEFKAAKMSDLAPEEWDTFILRCDALCEEK